MALRLRSLTEPERTTIGRLARSRTAPTRLVERARMIPQAARGEALGASAAVRGCTLETVRLWVKRFNAAVCPRSSALGACLPAQIRRLSQPDRALVESPALAGVAGTAL